MPRLEPLEVRTLPAGTVSVVEMPADNNVTVDLTVTPNPAGNNHELQTAAVNTAPVAGNLPPNQSLNDQSRSYPLQHLIVRDPDNQNMLAKVTVLNGTVRGDFTPASTTGFTRTVTGNNITYSRYYTARPNVGETVQAALRSFVFVPRANAIKPDTTELTDITVFVNDGVATATATTRLTVRSVNDAPVVGGGVAGQTMNDNQTKAVLSTITINDPDPQPLTVSVILFNGPSQGDFTTASTRGWTRTVQSGKANRIVYERTFTAAGNNSAAAQAATRSLIFQPRNNIPLGTRETTNFTVTVKDSGASRNTTASVVTTGVASRQSAKETPMSVVILDHDIETAVITSRNKQASNSLLRMLKQR